MYTTLNHLKASDACRGGYKQMVSFFGMSKKMKDRKLPLSLCALVLNTDNLEWLINNALIVEPEAYKKFYDKWIVKLNASRLFRMEAPGSAHPGYAAYMQFAQADTPELFAAAYEQHKMHSYHNFNLLSDIHWELPARVIEACLDNRTQTTYGRHTRMYAKDKTIVKPPVSTYFEVDQAAFLFSDDPYGEAIQFIMTNQDALPSKASISVDLANGKPKATFEVTGNEAVYNTYRFLSLRNKETQHAVATEDDTSLDDAVEEDAEEGVEEDMT